MYILYSDDKMDTLTINELRMICKELEVDSYHDMNKIELMETLDASQEEKSKVCVNGGNRKILCAFKDCKICEKKSFISSPFSGMLSPGQDVNPREIFMNSSQLLSFYCDVCCKIFETTPAKITKRKNPCPHKECSTRKKSFSHPLLKKFLKRKRHY